MKKLLLLFVLTVSVNCFAQSVIDDEITIIQDIYGKSKWDLVKEFMNLSDSQTATFQEIYDKYETERKELGRKKIQIIDEYAKNYSTLSPSKADELTQANFKNNMDLDKLLFKSYTKVKKELGEINAAKFVQLEQYLQVTIRSSIQDSIPFIGEMNKSKKE
ncbi:hypothetical protein [Flavobacterium fluviatile]|uniref:hypothetical protein n=1 Tax=Flavobacterium fluviatile TaxID=1862387 RepID=UPI0013D5E05A|nr:hypothetical protein [Flavobacterium fluviatile]